MYGAFTFQSGTALLLKVASLALCVNREDSVLRIKAFSLCVSDLVKLIERTVRSEKYRFPNRPIYIVGESIGACLALDVAARNPNIDLALILANPGTKFGLTLSVQCHDSCTSS